MKKELTKEDASEPLRYVYVVAPRCPCCDSKSLKVYAKFSEADGSVRQYTRCRKCKWTFRVISQ